MLGRDDDGARDGSTARISYHEEERVSLDPRIVRWLDSASIQSNLGDSAAFAGSLATQPDPRARASLLLGTRVTTTIPPNCPGTNTLPRELIADIALPIGCESAQTARNPRGADSSNAFDSDLGSWTVAHARRWRVRLSGSQCLVSSRSGTTVPKELDTRRRAWDAI